MKEDVDIASGLTLNDIAACCEVADEIAPNSNLVTPEISFKCGPSVDSTKTFDISVDFLEN